MLLSQGALWNDQILSVLHTQGKDVLTARQEMDFGLLAHYGIASRQLHSVGRVQKAAEGAPAGLHVHLHRQGGHSSLLANRGQIVEACGQSIRSATPDGTCRQ